MSGVLSWREGPQEKEKDWTVHLSLTWVPPASWSSRRPSQGPCQSCQSCTCPWHTVMEDTPPRDVAWARLSCESPMKLRCRVGAWDAKLSPSCDFSEVAIFVIQKFDSHSQHHLAHPRPLQASPGWGVGTEGSGGLQVPSISLGRGVELA